jgi:DNA-binding MarR family transcriptional regulator
VAARVADDTEPQQERVTGTDNPYSQAARLQRQMQLKRALSLMEKVERSFSPSELVTAIDEAGYDEEAAVATLRRLEGEGRVRRDDDELGWRVVAGSS